VIARAADAPAGAATNAAGGAADASWSLRARAVVSGGSAEPEPADFKAYSGIALEAAVRRALGPRWAGELSLHTASREIDHLNPGAEADRLGSLELLPATVALVFRPRTGGAFHPYAGAGVNLTVAWEKSGMLDSLDVSPHVGPAVQLGFDRDLGRNALLNVDVRWNTLRTKIANHGTRLARLETDPVTLGVGIGARL
jgi:outer membrane protein